MVLGNSIVYSLRVLPDHIDQPLRGRPVGRVGQGLAAIAHQSQPDLADGSDDRIASSIGIERPGTPFGVGHGGWPRGDGRAAPRTWHPTWGESEDCNLILLNCFAVVYLARGVQ